MVELDVRGPVATITLADEAHRNVLSRDTLGALHAALDAIERDPDVRVVVLTNQGRVFCAGADLAADAGGADAAGPGAGLARLLARVRRSPTIFVGRIAGHCVAGGVGLAAVMDISLALDTAQFGFSEVRVGVAPAIISVVCLPKMRAGDAREAFLRGRRFGAADAARLGLINAALPADELDAELDAVLEDLLAGEPTALGVAKALTYDVAGGSFDDALAAATSTSVELFARDAAREGMAAFLEKRAASWVRHWPPERPSP
ncbi:MAG: enoyl-CoA hydratase/isomerase family protein [Acidimicrobiales bacterium]